jgi:hypothetical protein
MKLQIALDFETIFHIPAIAPGYFINDPETFCLTLKLYY